MDGYRYGSTADRIPSRFAIAGRTAGDRPLDNAGAAHGGTASGVEPSTLANRFDER
jgi:hypothetical protein